MIYIAKDKFSHNRDPFIIQPYYTGRDKGPICVRDEKLGHGILTFYNEGRAWHYIFNTVQPNDTRACDNYKVMRVSEFERQYQGD